VDGGARGCQRWSQQSPPRFEDPATIGYPANIPANRRTKIHRGCLRVTDGHEPHREQGGAAMRLKLKPKGEKFFSLFSEAGANIGAGVEILREFVQAPIDQRGALATRMRDAEHAGDDATHAIIEHLDRSFVTPFDREDIYRLAIRLDDVLDYMDAAVDLATLYRVGELPSEVHTQVELLCQCAQLTAEAMPRLAAPQDLTAYWVDVNELENQADQVYRRLLSELFNSSLDPLTVMKLKEIIDQLESAADAFEHVADVVHTIAVKES
jgi:predicted phosphate transport protein (TIGR00153 family)